MLVAGVILLLIAVGAFFLARHQRGRLGVLASTETVACNAVVADQTCEVVGRTAAGPGGMLKGPASGKACVWYRHKITHHWEEWDRDSDGDMRRRNRSRVASDEKSSEVFAVRDQSGQVLVNPHGADIDDPVKSHRVRMDRPRKGGGGALGTILDALDDRDDEEIEIEEWILPPEHQLYVRAKPTKVDIGLVMIDPGDKHFLISTKSEEQLAGSAKTWATVATAVAVLAAIGGAVLVVLGAIG